MKISNISFENFRSFRKSEVNITDINVFLGKNDQGKSSILEALDVFFYDGKGSIKATKDDLNKDAVREGINEFAIGVQFEGFPDPIIIDETNETSLKEEYLLNKDGKLEIWKRFRNGNLSSTQIKCYHPCNDEFLGGLITKKIGELRDFIDKHGLVVSDRRKAAEMRKAIRDYFSKRDGRLIFEEVYIPIDGTDLKKIWDKLKMHMPVFNLFAVDRENLDKDSELQDPLKSRIKEIFYREDVLNRLNEVSEEIDNEIRAFAENTIEMFRSLTKNETEITPSIPSTEDLKWDCVYKNIGFNTEDDIPMNKRGSGFRRLVLLSSLIARTKEEVNNEVDVIYAIEEPESSLHPKWQKRLVKALIELAEREKYQVFLTTHSPNMMRIFEIECIKYVERDSEGSKVYDFNEDIGTKIIKTMGLLPDIGKVVVCVEGPTDKDFLLNINQNIEELKSIIDLKKEMEAGTLTIMPMNGSRLKDWIASRVLENTNALEFHLYDSDKGSDNENQYLEAIEKVNQRGDGSYGTLTELREIENYVPKDVIEECFGIELDTSDDWTGEDIPELLISNGVNMEKKDIKNKICGQCCKEIRKDHLTRMGTWNEIEGWFLNIKNMMERCRR